MNKIKIGIIGTSEIAFRRFLPALKRSEGFEYVGVASRDISKTHTFINEFGGRGYDGYDALIGDSHIEAVYIPLPPALHFAWAKKALEAGKHVLLEKPFTTNLENSQELINLAKDRDLALHENYMFQYHSQVENILSRVANMEIGDLRLVRCDFGFPFRGKDDFRYDRELGGGALLDCGGYTLKLASIILGEKAAVVSAKLNFVKGLEVDIYGCGTMENEEGLTAQISFGMDNSYRCSLEIIGSKGSIFTNRIFTAPDTLRPELELRIGDTYKIIVLQEDNAFLNSINKFRREIENTKEKEAAYENIMKQACILNEFLKGGRANG